MELSQLSLIFTNDAARIGIASHRGRKDYDKERDGPAAMGRVRRPPHSQHTWPTTRPTAAAPERA